MCTVSGVVAKAVLDFLGGGLTFGLTLACGAAARGVRQETVEG